MVSLDLLLLGAVAGFTIFLGLPIARIDSVSKKIKGILNAIATGILIFLLVDIMHDAMNATQNAVFDSISGKTNTVNGLIFLGIFVAGLAAGLLGLVWFEALYLKSEKDKQQSLEKSKRLALMIAIGIGLHNFSEGLAIGQSYSSGVITLALTLAVGFGLHNMSEGFGIVAPLSGYKPSWKFLLLLGLIGGGPTFLGAIIGSFWISSILIVLFLSLAGGAVIYVIKELLYHAKTQGEGALIMASLIFGFLIGFVSQMIIDYAVR